MTVSYTVTLNDPTHAADGLDSIILEDFSAAAQDWLSHLTGQGQLDFEIDLVPTSAGRAESAPATVVPVDMAEATPVYEPGTLHELRTGVDPNGTAPDAVISIDPNYLHQWLWADPTPEDVTDPVPADKVDLVSVLRHELGHDLGIISATSGSGAAPGWETTFDRLTVTRSDGTFFVGPEARAAYGGDVPLTSLGNGEAHSHLGNSVNEPAGTDLMNGVAFYTGTRYEVSALDLAILGDIGAPVVDPAAPNTVVAASDDAGRDEPDWLLPRAGREDAPRHSHHGGEHHAEESGRAQLPDWLAAQHGRLDALHEHAHHYLWS